MQNRILTTLLILTAVLVVFTQSQGVRVGGYDFPDAWKVNSSIIQPRSNSSGLRVPSLANKGCLGTDADGDFGTGSGCGGAGSATTTINGASGPTFTFSTATTGSDFTISTSSGAVAFNIPSATSTVRGLLTAADWTVFSAKLSTSTGLTTANFASANISQWTNNSNYLTTSTALTTANFATTSISQWNNDAGYVTSSVAAAKHPIQFIIENPTATENDSLFVFNATSTLDYCDAVNKAAGDTVTWNAGYATSRATATSSLSKIFSAATTTTATTTATRHTVNASTTPGTKNPFIFFTTAASSSQFTLTCYYTP